MTRAAFLAALEGAAAGWRQGDAAAVADCFAEDLEYLDPYGYRFTRRSNGPVDRHGHPWLDVAMERVGVAELKDNLSRYLRAAEAGAEVEVTDRDRPIAWIVPVRSAASARDSVRRARRPFAEIRGRTYPSGGWSKPSLELLAEERQGR